ncbi:DUF2480 family protein [Capnocytophaga sp. ARDL2]|uniref:DUF2480 family protein n=1 Tax=Capnocytophaga sp. ARDL2 TaxID=3238809 RepID=UPI0035576F50
MEEIVNKVANSSLEIFDLEDYYPNETIAIIDISQWLYEGIVLREKEFRSALAEIDWNQYDQHLVALHCSTDAIIPSWAMMLVASYLQPYAKEIVQGTKEQLLLSYYQNKINEIDFSVFQDKPTIIKGCAKKPIPEECYVMALKKMQDYARSIMFGEACSAVPIYKRKK